MGTLAHVSVRRGYGGKLHAHPARGYNSIIERPFTGIDEYTGISDHSLQSRLHERHQIQDRSSQPAIDRVQA